MREAIRHEKFLEVIAAQRFMVSPEYYLDVYRPIYNTNRMIFPASMHFNSDIVGAKTGFTNNSRHTLVSHGTRDGINLISVVMRADHRDIIYNDTRMLMDYGFGQFERHTIFYASGFEQSVDLVQRSDEGALVIGNMSIHAANDVVLSLPIGFDTSSITSHIQLPTRVAVPFDEDFVVGRIFFEYNDSLLGQVGLLPTQPGIALTEQELSALIVEAEITTYYVYTDHSDNLAAANHLLNISLAAAGIFIFAMMMLKVLRFPRERRRQTLGNYKLKYRYK